MTFLTARGDGYTDGEGWPVDAEVPDPEFEVCCVCGQEAPVVVLQGGKCWCTGCWEERGEISEGN